MATFIAIPLKKTSEVDLVKPMKNLFSCFCVAADEPVNYDAAISEFNKLRMNSTWRTLDKHESSLEVMSRYYDQLNFLDAKCPSVDFQVSFKWKDAFDKGGFFLGSASLTLSTLAYEKICILFNIGAMQSQVACSHISDTKNDEGLKLAAKYFQMASGTFQHLKFLTSTGAVKEPTPDLQTETLTALHALMLAQAQESFFFKATGDNMKDIIIAKVASRCEELYSDAVKTMQKESILHLWEKDWLPIVTCKHLAFEAVAEYYQSLVCKSKKEVGEELARLQRASELMKNAEAKGFLSPDFKDYVFKMTHNYEESKKDNDFIYHARIPDFKSLPPIGKAALAKPIFPGDKLNQNSSDLFDGLLPLSVQQAMSVFDLRKMEIVNAEKAKLQSETQMLNGILASLNLPAALEDTTGNCLPQSLRDKAKAVKDKGGIENIIQLLAEMPTLLNRNREILQECDRVLKDEEESDEELRVKFGSQWARTPSTKLNEPLKTNLQKYNQIISTAMSADSVVKEKYNTHKDKIMLLCLPEGELLRKIPSGSPIAACSSVEQLKGLMQQVDSLKSEREELLSNVEGSTTDMKAKFLSALTQEGNVNEEALSVETLGEVYGPLQKSIRENVSRQEQLLAQIQKAHLTFQKEKSGGGETNSRDTLLSELAAAHDAYMELTDNLEEGGKFYNNLTHVLVSFQNKLNDFCFARKTEKDELCRDLQKSIVSGANQPMPNAPAHHTASQKPERPPPPATTNATPIQQPSAQNWGYPPQGPPDAAQNPPVQPQAPMPYPAYPVYSYPYPAMPNTYNPYAGYGQAVIPPFPPAPGYQGQPTQPQQYPMPGSYPYPQQQYRPWSQ